MHIAGVVLVDRAAVHVSIGLATKPAKHKPVVHVHYATVHHEMSGADAAAIAGANPRFLRIIEYATSHDEDAHRSITIVVRVACG